MTTPSGRFVPNAKICTTFTSQHPEEWNPAWTVESILTGFLSFMTSNEHGSGCLMGREEEKRKFAKESKRWNSLECERFGEDFPTVHAKNVANESFTDEEMRKLKSFKTKSGVECINEYDPLMESGHAEYFNEGEHASAEDDFDFYDGEEDDNDYEYEDEGENYNTSDE
jgi:hypothetical protein